MRSLKHALLVAGAATLVTVPAVALSFQSAPAYAPVASTSLLAATAQDPTSAALQGTTYISADASLPTDTPEIKKIQAELNGQRAQNSPNFRRQLERQIANKRYEIIRDAQLRGGGSVPSSQMSVSPTIEGGWELQVPNSALDPTTFAQLAQSGAVTTAAASGAAGTIVTSVAQGIVSTVVFPLVIVSLPIITEITSNPPEIVVPPEPPFPSDISPT